MRPTFRNFAPIMKRLLSILTMTAVALTIGAQTAREEISANIYLAGSNYLDYDRQLPTQKLTPAPKGYEPYYMSHYGRHGSRWLISENSYIGPLTTMRDADSQGKLTQKGKDVLRILEEFYPCTIDRLGDLSTVGERQHHGIGKRMVQNFPEISMWENYPWGAYGANPLPLRFEQLWGQVRDKAEGGFPYSEGKFEDFNKVLYSQFYWDSSRGARDILREYVAHEYSPLYVDSIVEAILIIEKNIGMKSVNWDTHPRDPKVIKVPVHDFGAQRAMELLEAVDVRLPEQVRSSWRWRIMLLRARMDVALRRSGGKVTPQVNEMFRELQEISSVQKGDFCVRPPYQTELGE